MPTIYIYILVRGPTTSIEKVAKRSENPKSMDNYGNCAEIGQHERTWVANGAEIVENETKWSLAGPKCDIGVILC